MKWEIDEKGLLVALNLSKRRKRRIKEIVVPNQVDGKPVTGIDGDLFLECKNLRKIVVSEGIKEVKDGTFRNCIKLRELSLPKTIKKMGFVFEDYDKLRNLTFFNLSNINDFAMTGVAENFRYTYYDSDMKKLVLSMKKMRDIHLIGDKDIIKCENLYSCEKATAVSLLTQASYKELVEMSKREFKYIKCFIGSIYGSSNNLVPSRNFEGFFKSISNSRWFNKLIVDLEKAGIVEIEDGSFKHPDEMFNLFKLSYNLGIFTEKGQKVYSFLSDAFTNEKDKILALDDMNKYFDEMVLGGYNEQWSEFFMGEVTGSKLKGKQVLRELVEREKVKRSYIASTYNEFTSALNLARSRKGSQRQLKVTMEFLDEAIKFGGFSGVGEETKDIAEEISKFTHSQDSFNSAAEIRGKYLESRARGEVNDYILGERLVDKGSTFDQIAEERKKILIDTKDILNSLGEKANDFSYDFLSKYDPKNFVLGKYCSCCAHLEGAGKSIMASSILHPNCQNLVIRDKDGNIIAKSTLYVNRSQGYGVFNNIEVADSVNESDKEKIYTKYMEAVNSFATRYNELNPSNPIKQINVGMNNNDVEEIIKKHNSRGFKILKLDIFSQYGEYAGDWQKEQYVVWKNSAKELGGEKNGR